MSNGQRQNENSEMDILYIGAGIFIIVAVFLYFFHTPLVKAIFFMKYYELRAISFFSPQYEVWLSWLKETPPDSIDLVDLMGVLNAVGGVARYPVMGIGLCFSFILFFFHSDNTYRAIESMTSLSDKLSENFPASRVTEGLDLVNTPLVDEPWASALTPIEFAKKYKILYRDPATYQVLANGLKAKMIFSTQLGRFWTGVEDLLPHETAIFAALCTYINYSRHEADLFLENICLSVTPEKIKKRTLSYGNSKELIKKYANHPAVQKVIAQHAFVYTVFAGLLGEARKTGIVANSSYLWVKPMDRSLWYVLNNVGRKAVFIETAAVHAHWLAESAVGYPIYQPMIDETIPGLDEAVKARIVKGELEQ